MPRQKSLEQNCADTQLLEINLYQRIAKKDVLDKS